MALVRSLREEYDYPIFLNANHHYSFDKVKEAVDAGYDAVIAVYSSKNQTLFSLNADNYRNHHRSFGGLLE